MHSYLFRIPIMLWNRIMVEAESRGIKVSVMLREIVEKGLLKIYEEEAKYGEVKYK